MCGWCVHVAGIDGVRWSREPPSPAVAPRRRARVGAPRGDARHGSPRETGRGLCDIYEITLHGWTFPDRKTHTPREGGPSNHPSTPPALGSASQPACGSRAHFAATPAAVQPFSRSPLAMKLIRFAFTPKSESPTRDDERAATCAHGRGAQWAEGHAVDGGSRCGLHNYGLHTSMPAGYSSGALRT